MSADEKEVQVIPLINDVKGLGERIMMRCPSEAYYIGAASSIQTAVSSDLGTVETIVANLSTDESWSDIFDSGLSPYHGLQISGDSGDYEIVYITESGDLYQGFLVL